MYPGDYDDLTDSMLVELWLKKYPNDREKVKLNEIQEVNKNSQAAVNQNENKKNLNSNFWIFLIIGVVVISIIAKNSGGSNYNNNKSQYSTSSSQYSQPQSNSTAPSDTVAEKLENTLNTVGRVLDAFADASKSNEWVNSSRAYTCSKCNKTIQLNGLFKESTNEFKPTEDFPESSFFGCTHNWKTLK